VSDPLPFWLTVGLIGCTALAVLLKLVELMPKHWGW
jgi:hypothetical protein